MGFYYITLTDYYGPTATRGFHVDARPAGLIGLVDRFRVALNRYR